MILLEISFFRHYVFAVVQTASKPHPPRGQPTLDKVRARRRRRERQDAVDVVDMVDKTWTFLTFSCPLPSVIQQEKTKGTITTGTVALLFKAHAIPSV